jgi:hypothetical protein
MIHLKRAYEPASSTDGTRLLIERLWPRGVEKTSLKIKSWIKRRGPKHGAAEMVQSRSCEVGRVSQPLLRRTESQSRCLAADHRSSTPRNRNTDLQLARHRVQQCRGIARISSATLAQEDSCPKAGRVMLSRSSQGGTHHRARRKNNAKS